MKNKIFKVTILSLVLSACTWDDFGDLNVNPNQSTIPRTSALLTNAMLSLGGITLASQSALYVQHLANKQYTSADNYQTVNFSTDGFFNGPLMDLTKIIELNTTNPDGNLVDGSNNNQIAIAMILKCYYFLHMTDRWGDLPYSEALRGAEGLLTPAFDSQEDIYTGCIQDLKDAVAMMDSGPAIQGDILLGGDMDWWKKFANTIRMTAALRLSKVAPTTAATEFASAAAAGVIALDNSENIVYGYLNVQTYENPYYNSFVTAGRKDWTIADPLMVWLQHTSYTNPFTNATGKLNVAADPRLPVYAAPLENTTDQYVGMPYGLSEADAGSVPNSAVSFLGLAFRQQNSPAYLFTSAQVAFSLAEGRERGWLNSGPTAQEYYEAGILASLEQNGVEAGYATYITNSAVAYNAAGTLDQKLEQILTQKWLALFINGYEAWAEWRRTGFPALEPAGNAFTPDGEIPRRQAYGTTEANLNKANYEEALTRQGFEQDDLTGRLWWDPQ